MRVEPIEPAQPDPRLIREAADCLRGGGLVVFPTETVYGLGVTPGDPVRLARLFAAKLRPPEKAVAWLVAEAGTVDTDDPAVRPTLSRLAEAFWPGPLTVVVPRGGASQGYRVPDHPVALALLGELGTPLATSSANRSGEPPAVTGAEAVAQLGEVVDLILDAGPVPGGVASTVLRLQGDEMELLREGALGMEAIRGVLGG